MMATNAFFLGDGVMILDGSTPNSNCKNEWLMTNFFTQGTTVAQTLTVIHTTGAPWKLIQMGKWFNGASAIWKIVPMIPTRY